MQCDSVVDNWNQWGLALALLCCVLVSGGCDRGPKTAGAPPVPEVAVITVASRPVELTTELPGRTAPFRVAEIRPQVNGLIQKRLFTEGSDVQAGEALYRIDAAPFQAALDNAEAALGRSEANLPAIRLRVERYRELLAEKAVSQQEYDDAAAALKQAEADVRYGQAAVKTARINLDYTRITAPISGRIGRSTVTDGALVAAYQSVALTTLQQLDPIYVDVAQSTADLLRLRRALAEGRLAGGDNGRKVRLVLEDGAFYPLEGDLQFRDVTVDPTTGSVILRIVVPNPDGILLPGMFVRALIREGVNPQAILVPQQAVFRDPKGNPLVLTVDESGQVGQRMVVVDRTIGDQWLLQSGLRPGEKVIVEGLQKVRAGMTAKTIPFQGRNPENAGGEAPARKAAGPAGGER